MKRTITSASLKKSAAFRASVRNRPAIRKPTVRMQTAAHMYDDARRCRWVVYRTAGGITRKTSVRYESAPEIWSTPCPQSWDDAYKRAHRLMLALARHPAHSLRSFKWPR